MAKNANLSNFWHFFAIFRPLTSNKTSPNNFFSCRGGSKLRFGGSYVKIGQELASGMQILSR